MAPWSHAIDRVVTHVRRHCADFVTPVARGRHEANASPARMAALAGIGGPHRADEEITRSDPRDGDARCARAGDEAIRSDPNGSIPSAHERGRG